MAAISDVITESTAILCTSKEPAHAEQKQRAGSSIAKVGCDAELSCQCHHLPTSAEAKFDVASAIQWLMTDLDELSNDDFCC